MCIGRAVYRQGCVQASQNTMQYACKVGAILQGPYLAERFANYYPISTRVLDKNTVLFQGCKKHRPVIKKACNIHAKGMYTDRALLGVTQHIPFVY